MHTIPRRAARGWRSAGLAFLAAILALPALAPAQVAADDYRRAYTRPASLHKQVFGLETQYQWAEDGQAFWYRSERSEGTLWRWVDVARRRSEPAFDHARLAVHLRREGGAQVDAARLPLAGARIVGARQRLTFEYGGQAWCYLIAEDRLLPARRAPPSLPVLPWDAARSLEQDLRPVPSPDGALAAYVRDYNLHVFDPRTDQTVQLSHDGDAANYYSSRIQWSPDSRFIAAQRMTAVPAQKLYLTEYAPAQGWAPRLHERDYARAGEPQPLRVPHVFGLDGSVSRPAPELFEQPHLLAGELRWEADSSAVVFDWLARDLRTRRIAALPARGGPVRVLVEETSATYLNRDRHFHHRLADGRRVWMSERDGWNHLYLYAAGEDRVLRQITRGPWYVREVVRVDEQRQEIVFSANGMQPHEDPYLIRYYRVGLDGRNLVDLTPADGMHQAWFSPDGRHLVDTWSKVDAPPVTVLRDGLTGEPLMTLERVDDTALRAAGWQAPEVFTAKGRDGKTDIWGVILRPGNFDPSRRYPVVESIYADPGGQHVPKRFSPSFWWMSGLAELGFVVVQIDGMGTSFRSRAFQDVAWKNLQDAGLPDRIAWIRAAAARHPWIDADRVGIFGASAGGHSAMAAVLSHPDFYKAAFAAAGSHDNRIDKRDWNEQWMGYPVGPEYAAASNVDNAHRLARPLMLLAGAMDGNVDPGATLRVADALVKARKDFELVLLPSGGHTLGDAYGERKRYDFFVRHLYGIEPPPWHEVPWP